MTTTTSSVQSLIKEKATRILRSVHIVQLDTFVAPASVCSAILRSGGGGGGGGGGGALRYRGVCEAIGLWADWDHYGNKFLTFSVYILCLVRVLLHSS